jgi:hypothetical protein
MLVFQSEQKNIWTTSRFLALAISSNSRQKRSLRRTKPQYNKIVAASVFPLHTELECW